MRSIATTELECPSLQSSSIWLHKQMISFRLPGKTISATFIEPGFVSVSITTR